MLIEVGQENRTGKDIILIFVDGFVTDLVIHIRHVSIKWVLNW